MEQILQAYCLPKEIVTAIMKLSKNMKATVHSPNGDIDFFNWSLAGRYIGIISIHNLQISL